MILYNFQCQQCNQISEHFFNMSDCPATVHCPICQGIASKIISIPGPNVASDAPWIRSVLEVVQKDGARHCQEFLKDPTRANYKRWKKIEGIRHIEAGEKPGRPNPTPSHEVITDKLMQRKREREAICLRG